MSTSTATWQQSAQPELAKAPTQTRRTRVRRVVAVNGSQAWAYLEGVGWRRLSVLDGAGLQSLMAACCQARLGRRQVSVEVSSTHLLMVGE